MAAGKVTPVHVRVHNMSEHEWIQTAVNPLNVGNHWLDSKSEDVIEWNDGRGRLPGRLRPGESADVDLHLRPPEMVGRYRIHLDVVQEGAAWFATSGSEVLESPVQVVAQSEEAYGGSSFQDLLNGEETDRSFDMYGIPIDEVKQILEDGRATLLAADEWATEWHSFAYYVQGRS
jgi:hypothetical protein